MNMADKDCLGLADERQCEDEAHSEFLGGQKTAETHNDRPSVDNRSGQPEFTDPSQSLSTEASTTTTTTYTSPSSTLSDSNQSERNTSRSADYRSGLTEFENNLRRRRQVLKNDKDNNTNQIKNKNSSYKATASLQNGDTMKKGTSDTPTTPSQQQMTNMNSREYAQVVRAWLWQYHQWNSMCAFGMMLPYYAMATFPYYAANNYPSSAGSRPTVNGAASFAAPPGAAGNNNNQMGAAAGPADGGRANQSQTPPQTPQQNFRATEYMIPSLWKRILAELVDFVVLFYIKLMVSVMVMKHMGYIDLEKYDLEYNWFVTMDEFDLSKVFHFTSEVILFELLNRISITILETMCLRRGIGVVGGATPGKRLLGMKVVSCTDILDLGNGRIQVTPARDIGLYSALLRSILKNFTIAFFFPACLTVFFFDHNRAAYDVLAGSIVVQPVEEAGEL